VQKNWIGDIPNANVRDYQRKRLYNAEDSCLWGDMKIMTYKQVEELIYKISQWAEITPPRLITDENSIAYATANIICLPSPITRTVLFVTHEMSHVINYKGKNPDHHGKHFAGTYLEVVKEFIGENTYNNLRKAFDLYKVKYL
tara:strand:+ start:668 stop:1096 length:429 start_codon:yes stop_codon:yes gene_type:complete